MKKNKETFLFSLLTSPIFILFFLLVVLILITIHQTMGNDEGMWSYIGRVWVRNNLPPYTENIENKTPGIFVLFALSDLLSGVNIFFIRGAGILFILISALFVYLIGKKLHSRQAGILSMIVFGLTMSWEMMDGNFIAQTETFMILFTVLSFYFVIKANSSKKWKYWLLLSGISIGFAIAFKQIALLTALGLLIFFLVNASENLTIKNKILGIIILGTGFFIATCISITPLLASGITIKDYIKGAWLILQNQGSGIPLKSQISRFADIWLNTRIVFFYVILLFFIIKPGLIKTKYMTGLIIWLLFDFIGANSSGYYFGHQIKQILPSLSLITGIVSATLLSDLSATGSLKSKRIIIFIILLIIILLPAKLLLNGSHIIENEFENNHDKETGLWLKKHTAENDYVYMFGHGGNPVLSYSERVSSSKYFNLIFVTSDYEQAFVMNDLKTKTPLFILIPNQFGSSWWDDFDKFVKKNYILFDVVYDYRAYRLK